MKVLHLVSNRWNSAICEYALSTVRACKVLNYENFIVGITNSPFLNKARELSDLNEEFADFSPKRFFQLKKIIQKFKPDLIFSNGGPEEFIAHFAKPKSVKHFRFRGNFRLTPVLLPLAQTFYPSFFAKEKAKIDGPIIPLGTNEKKFNFANYNKIEVPSLLIFGRFDPIKGHENFLQLFKKIADVSSFEINLKIVGLEANTKASDLAFWAKSLGLEASRCRVSITTAKIEDVPALMRGVTAGVISSSGSEVICRVAQEFLMCGTPVLVTNIGSLPEVLKELSFGKIYPNLQPIEIVSQIAEYFQENAKTRNARAESAQRHFSVATMALKLKQEIFR